MSKKETFIERYKKELNTTYYQRRFYRNKIALPIVIGIFAVLFPFEIFWRKIFHWDPYLGSTLVLFISVGIGMTIGEHKANQKFGGK